MKLDDLVQGTNSYIYFREFSFNINNFIPQDYHELELADNIVQLDDILIIFQLKERNPSAKKSRLTNWYRKYIRNKAVSQIDYTHKFLEKYTPIKVKNNQRFSSTIQDKSKYRVINIICYLSDSISIHKNHYITKEAGFIHNFTFREYKEIAEVLITPSEIIEYLGFREKVIRNYSASMSIPSENALLGQFISADTYTQPHFKYEIYFDKLKKKQPFIYIKDILNIIGDRLYPPSQDNASYYPILVEINKLGRTHLLEIGKRFMLCRDAVRDKRMLKTLRMHIPETDCAFSFITMNEDAFQTRQDKLRACAELAKYSMKSKKMIGISFIFKDNGFNIDWIFIERKHQNDSATDKFIAENDFFFDMKEERIPRYL